MIVLLVALSNHCLSLTRFSWDVEHQNPAVNHSSVTSVNLRQPFASASIFKGNGLLMASLTISYLSFLPCSENELFRVVSKSRDCCNRQRLSLKKNIKPFLSNLASYINKITAKTRITVHALC